MQHYWLYFLKKYFTKLCFGLVYSVLPSYLCWAGIFSRHQGRKVLQIFIPLEYICISQIFMMGIYTIKLCGFICKVVIPILPIGFYMCSINNYTSLQRDAQMSLLSLAEAQKVLSCSSDLFFLCRVVLTPLLSGPSLHLYIYQSFLFSVLKKTFCKKSSWDV